MFIFLKRGLYSERTPHHLCLFAYPSVPIGVGGWYLFITMRLYLLVISLFVHVVLCIISIQYLVRFIYENVIHAQRIDFFCFIVMVLLMYCILFIIWCMLVSVY
jgi:hypothetical protein